MSTDAERIARLMAISGSMSRPAPTSPQGKAAVGRYVRGTRRAAAKKKKDLGGGLFDNIADVGASAVGKTLEVIDLPRATVMSGIREFARGVGNLAGDTYGPSTEDNVKRALSNLTPEAIRLAGGKAAVKAKLTAELDSDKIQPYKKPSFEDFAQGIKEHVGYRDVLSEGLKNPRGQITGFGPLDFGIGLGVDIAADPLSYSGVGATARLRAVPGLTEEAARVGADDLASVLRREKTLSALSRPELEQLGRETTVADTLRNVASGPARKVQGLVGDALDKSEALSKMRGAWAPARAAERSGDNALSRAGFEGRRVFTTETAHAAREMADLHETATGLVHGWSAPDKALLGRAVQGDEAARAALGAKVSAVPELRRVLDQAHGALSAAGVKLGYVDEYLPRVVEDEILKRAKGGARASVGKVIHDLAKSRKIGAGTKAFGETVPEGLNPVQVTTWMNERAQKAFGHDYYRTDVNDVLDTYFRGAAKKLGEARANQVLTSKGLAAPLEDVNTARANEAAVTRGAAKVDEGVPDPTELQQAIADLESRKDQLSPGDRYWLSFLKHKAESAGYKADLARGASAKEGLAEARAYGKQLVHDTTGRAAERVASMSGGFGDVITADGRAEMGGSIRMAAFEQVAGHPDFAYSPELAGILDKVNALTAPKTFGEFISTYDKVLSWLKSYQILTPGFHFRNTYGGLFNNALAGVSPSTYPKWFKANSIFSQEGEAVLRQRMGDKIADAYLHGRTVAGRGQIGFESAAATGGTKLGHLIPGGPNFKLLELSHQGGTNVEGFLRGSLAMDALLKSESLATAHDLVTKYHFDYADLTGFEKNTVKRVIPFYTWTRHNVPLQAEMLLRRPSVYSKLNSVTRNIGAGVDLSGTAIPDYYDQSGAYATPFKEQGQPVLGQLAGTLPIGDLYNVTDPGTVPSMVSPLIKTPIEMWSGKQVFKGLPLTNKRVDAPLPLVPFKAVLQAAGLADKDGKITEKNAYAMNQFMPLLSVIRRGVPTEKKYQERVVTSWVNLLFGLGVRTVTKSEQKNARKYGRAERIGK